jgi:two-component sensor histidine kinase
MNGSVGTLVVADEGIGTTWPPKNSGGIGSMIIESMVHSVKGKLRYEGAGGSSFAVDVAVGGAAEARSV